MRQALALCVALSTSASFGALVLDGNVATNEYQAAAADTSDPIGAQFIGTGLDMTAIYGAQDVPGGKYWLALTTAAAIDTNGDDTSILKKTYFVAELLNGATPVYLVNVDLTAQTIALSEWTGSSWTPVSTAGVQMHIDTAIEVSIPFAVLPYMPQDPSFVAQLDGTGEWMDDQMSGKLPEPAGLALLAVGLPILLRRRKRD